MKNQVMTPAQYLTKNIKASESASAIKAQARVIVQVLFKSFIVFVKDSTLTPDLMPL